MSNLINGFNKVRRQFKSNKSKVMVITPLGERRRERVDLPEYQWKVLDELHSGPSTVRELARQTGLSESKVKMVAKNLKAAGYIQFSSDEDS